MKKLFLISTLSLSILPLALFANVALTAKQNVNNIVPISLETDLEITKTYEISKTVEKYVGFNGNYSNAVPIFTLNMPSVFEISIDQLKTSTITIEFDSSVWNQSSDEKGFVNHDAIEWSIAYSLWETLPSKIWNTTLPKLEQKTYNGIYSVQNNILTLEPDTGDVTFKLNSSITSWLGFLGSNSENNSGTTRTGIKSISASYVEEK